VAAGARHADGAGERAHVDLPAVERVVGVDVCADSARRGIGAALLERLILASERAGARQMIAVIGDSANIASIHLHAAAGFAPVGIIASVGWKFQRWLDVVLMQRALGVGNARPA